MTTTLRVMISRVVALVTLSVGLAFGPANAQSAGDVYLGVHGGYNFNDLNAAAVGFHAVVGLPLRLAIYPAASVYMLTPGSLWIVGTSIRWAPLQTHIRPYLGLGPYWSSLTANLSPTTTDVGFLTLVGAELKVTGWQSFAELQILKDGAVSTQVVAGLRLRLRHT